MANQTSGEFQSHGYADPPVRAMRIKAFLIFSHVLRIWQYMAIKLMPIDAKQLRHVHLDLSILLPHGGSATRTQGLGPTAASEPVMFGANMRKCTAQTKLPCPGCLNHP
jgi:hypothetical protein